MTFRAVLGLPSEILSRELIHSFPQNARELWLSKAWKKKIWGSLYSLAVGWGSFTIVQNLAGNPEISHHLFLWCSGFILCGEQQFKREQTDKAKPISFGNSPGQVLGTYKQWLYFSHTGDLCSMLAHRAWSTKGKVRSWIQLLEFGQFWTESTCVTFFTERVKCAFRNKTWNKLWLQSFKWALLNWKTDEKAAQTHLFEGICEITALEQKNIVAPWTLYRKTKRKSNIIPTYCTNTPVCTQTEE